MPHGIPEVPAFGLVSFRIYVWQFKANDRNDQQIL